MTSTTNKYDQLRTELLFINVLWRLLFFGDPGYFFLVQTLLFSVQGSLANSPDSRMPGEDISIPQRLTYGKFSVR